MTFGEAADALISSKESEWRNAKHRAQWAMTLEKYAAPLRPSPVAAIDTEAVLDYARALGEIPRNEANPARWRGHLDKLLPKRGKLTRGHHAAMDYTDVPAFVGQLRERQGIASLALEFTILTAARSGEVLGARWFEFDFEKRIWIIPASRMKSAREHRVPLSDRALAILERLREARDGEFVFPGARARTPISIMAMAMVLQRMKMDGVTSSRLSFVVPRLGRRNHKLSAPNRGGRAGAHRRRRGGARISPRRRARKAPTLMQAC